MLHRPAAPSGKDPSSGYKAKLGVRMFLIYGLIYAGFVVINVTNPLGMDRPLLFGLNLAVVYGMGLIILALVLSLVYNHLCAAKERELGAPGTASKKEL